MTDYEDLLRQSAAAPGWTIEARQNRISARGVPYRKKGGEAGRCQIAVETQEDGLTMQAPEHGGRATPRGSSALATDARTKQVANQLAMSSGQTGLTSV